MDLSRWSRYRFRSAWRLDAEPDTVYGVLEQPDRYPDWWPQIREVRQTGETTGVLRFRSLLPYDLTVAATTVRHDPGARILEAAMSGDLEGWVRWTVLPAAGPAPARGRQASAAGGTHLLFEQEVVVRKALMRRLAVPCRPLFRANHALMMRSGRAGMRAFLAGPGGGSAGGPAAGSAEGSAAPRDPRSGPGHLV